MYYKYNYLEYNKDLKDEIEKHKKKESISKTKKDKDLVRLNFERSLNELKLSESIFSISNSRKLKEKLNLIPEDTFYSGVIAHAYYAIFYSVKALLFWLGIKTDAPNIHKATLDAFAYYLVRNGKLDLKLLHLYKSNLVKADSLLGLFIQEKEKRGRFTYKQLPQSNKEPALESIENARTFLRYSEKVIYSK